jgi:hypothetical protein
MDSVGVRVQHLEDADQVLVLGRLAQSRSGNQVFKPADVHELFDEIGLPRPSNTSYFLKRLRDDGFVTTADGAWRVTPRGRARALELVDDMDLAVLMTEADTGASLVSLGSTAHPLIPSWLAPPDLIRPIKHFLEEFPFEFNVFGMTRFPDSDEDSEEVEDPLAPAIEVVRKVTAEHGLTLHLASDRKIVDDLWPNVAAHIWSCKYGIAFFEDRRERGINYNLSIEVGSCLVLGRRLAILKDKSIEVGQRVERLPTDLTGKIYTQVDLDDLGTVQTALEDWYQRDLRLPS